VGTQPQAKEALGFLRLDSKESHKAYDALVRGHRGGQLGDTRCGGHRE